MRATTGGNLRGRVNVSNSAISASQYDWAFTVPYRNNSGGSRDLVSGWQDTDFRMSYNGHGTGAEDICTLHMQIYNPLGATYKMINFNARGSSSSTSEIGTSFGGVRWNQSTALTGITLFPSGGNLYGTFKLYGVK